MWRLSLALVLSALVCTELAFAHGRAPAATGVLLDPDDPARIYLRTTYGLLVRPDHQSWYWICPDAIGYGGLEDPALAAMAAGKLLVGFFDGLALGRGQACQFERFSGELEKRNFKAVVREANPSHALAVTSNCALDLSCEVRLFQSTDGGESFAPAGVAAPSDFLATGLAAAPSDPQRIYVSGKNQPPLVEEGSLMRSDDRGQSWTRLSVPDSDIHALPRAVGVDPSNPDRLYLARTARDPDDYATIVGFSLLVSDDGGASFSLVFERPAAVPAFAISPDGSQVAIGGPTEGLFVAEAATLDFVRVSDLHVGCLHWVDAGIYACADDVLDGFHLGASSDGGKTFTPLGRPSGICGPPPWCAGNTSVGAECPVRWLEEQGELGASSCDGPPNAPPPEPAADGGCGCRAAPSKGAGAWLLISLLLLRRRRSRRG